jgi:hypothetical protein
LYFANPFHRTAGGGSPGNKSDVKSNAASVAAAVSGAGTDADIDWDIGRFLQFGTTIAIFAGAAKR